MKIEITEDFLIIRVPKAQAEKINLFELRAFIEQGKPLKQTKSKPSAKYKSSKPMSSLNL